MLGKQCTIRKDLLQRGLAVSVGKEFVFSHGPFYYIWSNEDDFQILLHGEWQNAQSIDFEF